MPSILALCAFALVAATVSTCSTPGGPNPERSPGQVVMASPTPKVEQTLFPAPVPAPTFLPSDKVLETPEATIPPTASPATAAPATPKPFPSFTTFPSPPTDSPIPTIVPAPVTSVVAIVPTPNDSPFHPTAAPATPKPKATAKPTHRPGKPAPKPTAKPKPKPTAKPTAKPVPTATPAKAEPPIAGEAVRSSDGIVDHIGFDTHFNYHDSEYATDPRVLAGLIASGVRHVRDSAIEPQLAAHGITHGIGFNANDTAAQMLAKVKANPNGLDYVEGANELDYPNQGDWVTKITNLTKVIWATFHGKYTVVASPFSHATSYAKMPDLSAYMDRGNQHDGTCAYNPETDSNNALGPKLKLLEHMDGTRVVWTTETGYNDTTKGGAYGTGSDAGMANPNGCYVDDYTQAKYVPRTVAERITLGQGRIYFYQFSVMAKDKVFGQTGMFAHGKPKPQLVALESMIKLLTDKGPAFTPTDLHVKVAGDVHSIIAGKRDGSAMILVWQPAYSWDRIKFVRIPVPATNVVISSNSTATSAKVYTYDETDWSLTPHDVAMSKGSLTLPVGDSITFVAFPARAGGAPSTASSTSEPVIPSPTAAPILTSPPTAAPTSAPTRPPATPRPTAQPTPKPTPVPVRSTSAPTSNVSSCEHFIANPICKPLPSAPSVSQYSNAWAALNFQSGRNSISGLSVYPSSHPFNDGSNDNSDPPYELVTAQTKTTPQVLACDAVSYGSYSCGLSGVDNTTINVPTDMEPEGDSDHHFSFGSVAKQGEYDFWLVQSRIQPAGAKLHVGGGGFCAWSGDGTRCSGANATNIANTLGSVTESDFVRAEADSVHGNFGHAVSFSVLCADPGHVFPASASDGTNTNSYPACAGHTGSNARPPEGVRVFVNYTDAQINAMNLHPYEKAFWRTVDREHFGGIVTDTTWSGGQGLNIEQQRDNFTPQAREGGNANPKAYDSVRIGLGSIKLSTDMKWCSSGTC